MLEGRDVAIGIAGASALLFVVELARVKDLRKEVKYSGHGQGDVEAFITTVLTFTAMGLTIDWTADVVTNPKELSW
jgi:hypothetical protein